MSELDKGVVLLAQLLRQDLVVLFAYALLALLEHAFAYLVHLVHREQRYVIVVVAERRFGNGGRRVMVRFAIVVVRVDRCGDGGGGVGGRSCRGCCSHGQLTTTHQSFGFVPYSHHHWTRRCVVGSRCVMVDQRRGGGGRSGGR